MLVIFKNRWLKHIFLPQAAPRTRPPMLPPVSYMPGRPQLTRPGSLPRPTLHVSVLPGRYVHLSSSHFFLGIISYFSHYSCLCCSADHLIKTATRASNSCASTAMQSLISPNSLEPDSGYVRSSGLGPGPTNNPDPTLTTITKNRARASATDTW